MAAINLDIILDIEESIDGTYIYIKDITGTCKNTNGFQAEDGSCNTQNPKISEVDSVSLLIEGGGLDGRSIALTSEQITDFFDVSNGLKLLCTEVFNSSVNEFPYGVYSITVTCAGTSATMDEPGAFSEQQLVYSAFISKIMEYVRGYTTNVSMPPEDNANWYNTVLNQGVIHFLIDDVQYACDRGLKDKADEIISAIDDIISDNGQILEFVTF